MINEIISVGDEITQFQFILGQLTSDQITDRYPFNYCIPDQEIWIVGSKERLAAFVLVSFNYEPHMWSCISDAEGSTR